MKCASCKKHNATYCCSGCELVTYCKKSCQSAHWINSHWIDHGNESDHNNDAISFVLPGLYVGSIDALKNDEDILLTYHIGAVVTAMHTDSVSDEMLDAKFQLFPVKINRMRISIHDHPDEPIEEYFDRVADFIHYNRVTRGVNVLVHCAAGVSRSVSFIVYYMLKYVPGYTSVKSALAKVREQRPWVKPNKGFKKKLEQAAKNRFFINQAPN
jgi:atypical dual specificity phosphatase